MAKEKARQIAWSNLRRIAKPDSRFHLDFGEYIPDFEGSREAIERLLKLEIYQQAKVLFITPDNCLERLRAQSLRDGKVQIVATYGIRRGMVELRPEDVPDGMEDYAVLLDLLERFGHYRSLAELKDGYKIDLMVTGGSVVSRSGVRFGKGHGFFDLEWAMLYHIGAVDENAPVAAVVHDCQITEIDLTPSVFDTVCDVIVTPTQVFHVDSPQKPVCGVIWEKLEPGMLEDIPPLRELKQMEERGVIV